MQFPLSVFDKYLKQYLKPGHVIKCEISLPDGSRPFKRLMILSADNEKTILLLTTTSNKFAPTRHFGKNDILVHPNEEKPKVAKTAMESAQIEGKHRKRIKESFPAF